MGNLDDVLWRGKPVAELDREGLLQMVLWMANKIERLESREITPREEVNRLLRGGK